MRARLKGAGACALFPEGATPDAPHAPHGIQTRPESPWNGRPCVEGPELDIVAA